MIRALSALAIALFSPAVDTHPVTSGSCVNAMRISACGASGSVDIHGSGSRASGSASSSGTPEVGSKQYVGCDGDVVGKLRALRDPRAVDDAHSCIEWKPGCDEEARKDGRPRFLAIRLVKQDDGTWSYNGGGCYPAAKPSVTPQMVIDRAARLIPTAAIGVAPKAATLVNMQTIMWVDAPTKQTLPAARILGKQVRITIVLDHVNWSFGDGRTDTATNPGKRYDGVNDTCETRLCPDYYGHIYANKGRTTLAATAAWRATFTVGTGPPTTIPGTINGPTARSPIRVREARAVLVDNPHN